MSDSEFDVDVFVDKYEYLSDAFIDIQQAASSLVKIVGDRREIFEIGLGVGYFAKNFIEAGKREGFNYHVRGIQPGDGMLRRLKEELSDIEIKAESYLQNYEFDQQYEVIVSHSSVFTVTSLDTVPPSDAESNLIFQSFMRDRDLTFSNIKKVMDALTPSGMLCMNIQVNPYRLVVPEQQLVYEQIEWHYDLECEKVRKVSRITDHGRKREPKTDVYFVLPYHRFVAEIHERGYQAQMRTGRWVVLANK